MTTALLAVAAALLGGGLGAVAYRWRGGGFFSAPRPFRLAACLLPLFGPLLLLGAPWWAALVGLVVALLGLNTGHGGFQDYGYTNRETHEKACVVVHRLTSARDGLVHDAIGMALTGLLWTLPVGVLLAIYGHPLLALAGLGGALKALAYWIGWSLRKLTHPTELAELLTGFFAFAPIAAGFALALS